MNTTVSTAVLDALEFDQMTSQEQEELLLELGEILFSSTMVRFLERLNEPAKEELSQILAKDNADESFQAFVDRHADESNSAAEEALQELTSDILTVTGHQPA